MLVGMCLSLMVDGWVGKRMTKDMIFPYKILANPRFCDETVL